MDFGSAEGPHRENRRFPSPPLTPRSQQNCKARSCLSPLQPLSIARRSLDEWPKAGSDDIGEWLQPPTIPGGRGNGSNGERTLWLQDSPSEDTTSILYDVIDYFEDVRKKGGRVFVHCCQGVSRSTSLVIAYLMWREGQSFDDEGCKRDWRLGLEYVDLYLIHFPVRLRQGAKGIKYGKEDILPLDMKGTWEDMEQCCKLGLAKSIGVSNFGVKKLSQLVQNAIITPALVQVEMNAAWQQENLRKFCKERGIHVSAWSPLGANGAVWGSLAVMDSPILKDIAYKSGKSVAQVALRWIIEEGATPIVKSFNSERMKQNLKIFDWELSESDSEKIKEIPQHRGFKGERFVSEFGPFKTFEELWE
ncbi:methylecgonone reductase-like [Vigna radiata var. radiata]|uniref:Methylecgonone reductase-like n=1 Tax=Vigna radiata var. radiata TaxID=3916 RepID=A0A3Q0F7L0_VIGRR|nr:methylecgonone reductase-like [Vigna radiata var. radiata]